MYFSIYTVTIILAYILWNKEVIIKLMKEINNKNLVERMFENSSYIFWISIIDISYMLSWIFINHLTF